MGIYLVSVGAQEWFDAEEDGWGDVSSALAGDLARRGLPPFTDLPEEPEFERGSGQAFEEKLTGSMDGFVDLCEAHLSREEAETLYGWSVLVPFSLEEQIWLPTPAPYSDETLVVGAPQALALAERLAEAVGLPDEVPGTSDNLELTSWFRDEEVEERSTAAAVRPGRWSEDLDTAFYVALYLRAAQHSIRRGCPIVLT
ncbi:hypothetical protein [Streptomyces sp. NPDC060198]|uniref:hypothetical protein n=1 Tax=Streptomyces sp. NPDC060198 TaxID=3347070 RepID=UPI0036489F01